MSIGNKMALFLLSLSLMSLWWMIIPQLITIPEIAKYKSDFILIFLGWAICLSINMFVWGLPGDDSK